MEKARPFPLSCHAVRFWLRLSAPAFADVAGERRYNFVTKKYEFYDGTDWYNFELGVPSGCLYERGGNRVQHPFGHVPVL
jgi:hypothetical protein